MFNPLFLAETPAATFDLTSIMTTAVDTIKGDLFDTLGIVVPAVVSVTAAVVCVRFGLKWLRQLGKN